LFDFIERKTNNLVRSVEYVFDTSEALSKFYINIIKVLVTGADGCFIGSHLTEMLLHQCYRK